MVKHKGCTCYINYLNSDGYTLGLLNRFLWEIRTEDDEELDVYGFSASSKKELMQIKKNVILMNGLIDFCIKHFNDYQPTL